MDFKNTILIMTSNIGSDILLDGIKDGEIEPEARARVDELLRRSFRPEFLNRIDETVCYKPLTESEIGQIAELQLRNLRKNLDGKQLKLEITDAAKEMIVREGYDPVYGARPLKRFIQSRVETAIAKCILRDDPAPGDTVTVDVTDGEITARL